MLVLACASADVADSTRQTRKTAMRAIRNTPWIARGLSCAFAQRAIQIVTVPSKSRIARPAIVTRSPRIAQDSALPRRDSWRSGTAGCAPALLDYLVRPFEQSLGNDEAQCISGLAIDHEAEMRRLLERQIGGFGALQDASNQIGDPFGGFAALCAIGHQSAL